MGRLTVEIEDENAIIGADFVLIDDSYDDEKGTIFTKEIEMDGEPWVFIMVMGFKTEISEALKQDSNKVAWETIHEKLYKKAQREFAVLEAGF